MSESFQPVEPEVRPVDRPGPRRSATSTAIALLALALVIVVAAAVAISRPPIDPVLVAGASASAEPAAASAKPDGSGKPDKDKSDKRGRAGIGRDIRITAISGDQVSLATDDGWKRTVTVTDTTEIRKGGQDVTVSALDVGDDVRLAQQKNDDGTYTVTAIVVPTPVTGGEVTAVSADRDDPQAARRRTAGRRPDRRHDGHRRQGGRHQGRHRRRLDRRRSRARSMARRSPRPPSTSASSRSPAR